MSNEKPEELDPSVPTDLLDLYVQLEEQGIPPEKMSEAFDEAG